MFFPAANNATALDNAVRSSLAASVSHIVSAADPQFRIRSPEADTAIAHIRTHRVRPGAFGRYYKLVLAIESRQFDLAQNLFLELASIVAEAPEFSVVPFTDAALGAERRLYGEVIDPDPGDAPWMVPPTEAKNFGDLVHEALRILDIADKDLANEIRGLVVEVAGASEHRGPNARAFGSVSSLMLWGLLIMNTERHQTVAQVLLGMVHEATHLLLFAHSVDEPLVINPIDERYPSPLRSDPRPMDGVYHATFVISRISYVLEKLRQATTKDFAPMPVDQIDERLAFFRERYFGGIGVIQKHGKLTDTGRRILDESLEYMKAS